MIGLLPDTLNVGGEDYKICTDYKIALLIFEAFNDPDLSEAEKGAVMLESLYEDFTQIPPEYLEEAMRKAALYLDGVQEDGGTIDVESKNANEPVLISWEQDEKMIFAAVNKVAGCEVRALPALHWWSFLGYFSEMGECLLNTVISIRRKKAKHKPLEKWEKEFYKNNRDIIDIKKKYSASEQARRDYLNALLNGEIKEGEHG